MVLRLEKDLPLLLFGLVCTSTVASLPQVQSAWAGIKEVYGEQEMGLRLLREAMLALLVCYAWAEPRLRNGIFSGPIPAFLSLIAAYVLCEIGYAVYLDLPLIVPMTGLRIFEYLPLALIGFVCGRRGVADWVIGRFAHYLRYYLLLQAGLALAQAPGRRRCSACRCWAAAGRSELSSARTCSARRWRLARWYSP